MSDIAERLRTRYGELEMDTDRKSVGWEAADEIERLWAALLLAGKVVREANEETSRACIADAVDAVARRALEGKSARASVTLIRRK